MLPDSFLSVFFLLLLSSSYIFFLKQFLDWLDYTLIGLVSLFSHKINWKNLFTVRRKKLDELRMRPNIMEDLSQ